MIYIHSLEMEGETPSSQGLEYVQKIKEYPTLARQSLASIKTRAKKHLRTPRGFWYLIRLSQVAGIPAGAGSEYAHARKAD